MSSLGTSRIVGISGTALRPEEGKKTVPEIEIGCFSGDHDFFLLDKRKFSDKKSVSNEKGKKQNCSKTSHNLGTDNKSDS